MRFDFHPLFSKAVPLLYVHQMRDHVPVGREQTSLTRQRAFVVNDEGVQKCKKEGGGGGQLVKLRLARL